MKIIKIQSDNEMLIIAMSMKYTDYGYTITKAHIKKRLFRKPIYFVELTEPEINFRKEIERALAEERYEDVVKLQKLQNEQL